jgi:hypothetical protein
MTAEIAPIPSGLGTLPRPGEVFSLAIHDGTTALRFWRTSEYGICTFQRIQQPATRRFSAHCVANSEFRFSYKRTFYVILSFGKNTKNLVP